MLTRQRSRNVTLTNVHPQRSSGRRTDGGTSGTKGTAVIAAHDGVADYAHSTVSDGIVRRREPLQIPPLSSYIPPTLLTIYLTSNPLGGTRVDVPDATFTKNLESIKVVSWQFTADLEDPNLSPAALPEGPVLLRLTNDKLSICDTVATNLDHIIYPTRLFPLLWNLTATDAFTEMPANVGNTYYKRFKDGDGHVRHLTIELLSPSFPHVPVSFTAATIVLELQPTSW